MLVVGHHAPDAAARTGVADYAAALAEALASRVRLLPRARPGEAPVHLYHLGNNPLHQRVHEALLANRSSARVALLHDATLQHFYLGSLGSQEAYEAEFVRQYGAWHRETARALWSQRALSAADGRFFHDFPMLGAVAAAATAIVVHNRAAAAIVRRAHPAATVHVAPHLAPEAPAVCLARVETLRQQAGVPPRGCLFAVFGHLRPSKRVAVVLRAFARVHARYPETRLLVAGEPVSAAWAASLAWDHPAVLRLPYLPGNVFWQWAHAADVCLNLRSPSAGETSGVALRLMAAGKPVVVTDGDEWADVPFDAVVRIGAGPAEQEQLEAWMAQLALRAGWRQRIGAAARDHLRRFHPPDLIAQQMAEILERAASAATFPATRSSIS